MNEVVEAQPKEQRIAPYQAAIKKAEDKFREVAEKSVNYDRECIFAMQALMKTDFAMQTANKNPKSVHLAMINVASTGLTLNPANAYAYLIPRDGAIVLDISYKGLIKIATDTGSIRWGRAEIVYESDTFEYHGPAREPIHKCNPFKRKDDDQIIGVYCIAKTSDGDILTEVMGADELEKIRGKSMSYAKKKSGPWVEWFEQMAKKAVIKRASKTWPYTERAEKLNIAVEMANEAEGGYDLEAEAVKLVSQDQAATIRDHMEAAAIDPTKLLSIIGVEAVEAIPANRFTEVVQTIKEASQA